MSAATSTVSDPSSADRASAANMQSFSSTSMQPPADGHKPLLLIQVLVYLEMFVALAIFVFTMLGVSIYEPEPVCQYFYLSLLELLITLPGVVYALKHITLARLVYATLQLITAVCAVSWVVMLILGGGPVGNSLLMGILGALQLMCGIIALFAHRKTIKCCKRCSRNKGSSPSYETACPPPDAVIVNCPQPEIQDSGEKQSTVPSGQFDQSSKRSSEPSSKIKLTPKEKKAKRAAAKKRYESAKKKLELLRRAPKKVSFASVSSVGASPLERNMFADCTDEEGQKVTQQNINRMRAETPPTGTTSERREKSASGSERACHTHKKELKLPVPSTKL